MQEIQSSACGVDEISIKMLKMCSPYILPFITNIVNSCILESYFPHAWKQAIVTPLAKIDNPKTLKDIRSVSILPVLSKILEKVISNQIRTFLDENGILPEVQSGFRPLYSCTTALADINDAVLGATDKGMLTVLVLLDYSRAFDTVRHETLLLILRSIGFAEQSVSLMSSYLSGRTQRVRLREEMSEPLNVGTGVPQGSILGPLLFTLYTCRFHVHVKHCSIHMYADDTQLYYSFKKSDLNEALVKINNDLQVLQHVSDLHSLHLNPGKTKAILFGSSHDILTTVDQIALHIDNVPVEIVDEVKNLGLVMDNTFRYRKHISNCIRKGYASLRLLYPHRSYLSQKLKIKLCESLVLSKVMYCCQIFYPCLDQETLNKIQVLQNSCLRYIYGLRKYDRVSYALKDAKWLNMKNRYHLLTVCFYHRILTQKTPPYLYYKIRYRTDVHNVNVRRKNVLCTPRFKLELFRRSFSYDVCARYNSLPDQFKNDLSSVAFKWHFKKFLFEER